MNILTKIAIVVVVVTSVFGSAVFITFATAGPNWKDQYNQKSLQYDLTAQANRQLNLALRRAQLGWDDDRTRLAAEEAKAKAAEQASAAKLDEQTAENIRNKEIQANNTAALKDLQLSLDAALKRDEDLSNTLNKEREEKNKSQEELRVATETLSQRNLDLEKFQKNIDYLQEQIGDLKDQLASKGAGTVSAAPGRGEQAAAAMEPDVKVTGTLTLVRNDLASINVGSAQGVKKGMKMMIYRDKTFVAYLQVQDVDVNTAGGVIVSRQVEPLIGDKVETVR